MDHRGERHQADHEHVEQRYQCLDRPSGPVYGTCLAPTYPSQLLIALAQLTDLPIGAWRGEGEHRVDARPLAGAPPSPASG
jgi:hypothetical protein